RDATVTGVQTCALPIFIGTGRMGLSNLEDFAKQPDVEIAAVCDVYQPNLEKGLKATDGKAKTYKDFREVLDRKDINVAIVATPEIGRASCREDMSVRDG